MTCREFIDFVWKYLDDLLPQQQRAKFDEHLAICPGCKNYLTSYRETVHLLGTTFDDLDAEVPEDVPEELIAAILDARSRPAE